jgi:Protein of unknown function (DUF4238)
MNTANTENLDNTKKEHYVPRFYLERFSNLSRSGNQKKIWVFDKITQKSPYSSDIKDTATSNYFYDFLFDWIEEDKKKVFDTHLQKREDCIAPFYRKFEKRLTCILKLDDRQKYKTKIIKKGQKKYWSSILAVQALRTPEFRNLLKEVKRKAEEEKISPCFLEQKVDESINQIKKHFPRLSAELIKEIRISLINSTSQVVDSLYADKSIVLPHYNFFRNHVDGLSKIFLKHKWVIGINQTNIPFYTSDHPVVIPYFETGYSSEGVEILFPINSKVIFVVRDKKHPRSNEGDCKLVNLIEDEIISYNQAQVHCSKQFIYCQENKFELAQKICRSDAPT